MNHASVKGRCFDCLGSVLHVLKSNTIPCMQVGHVEDVVVDDGYRGQKMGQRFVSYAGGPVHPCCIPRSTCAVYGGSLLRWWHTPSAKGATKSSLTAQIVMYLSMKSVVLPERKSRWSVTCGLLLCSFEARANTSLYCYVCWSCRLCT